MSFLAFVFIFYGCSARSASKANIHSYLQIILELNVLRISENTSS